MMKCDFLVVGSGIAGLNFALKASESGSVCLITKKDLIESNTNFAQGGIAAVFSRKDSFDLHLHDTLKSGDGLCNVNAVRMMVKEAPHEIDKLLSLGTEFDMKGNAFDLGKEGGHSRKRIVHKGDMTGAEIERALVRAVRGKKNIRIFEKHLAFELIVKAKRCIGARVFDERRSKVRDFFAKAVVLATGGLCEVYENSSNPSIATGDGIAMAFRAGCRIEGIEFIQFHPTAFRRKGKPFFLISETVRGEGGKLLNSKGKRFVKELKTRDEVSRAIYSELKKGKVYLDITEKNSDFVMKRFSGIYKTLKECGINMTVKPVPVEPVAHYACGGIKTDLNGRTDIPGLFAVGEVAFTGVHGANRLASNSLLESLVFSSRTARAAEEHASGRDNDFRNLRPVRITKSRPSEIRMTLKGVMWRNAGIIRNEEGLREALANIEDLQRELDARVHEKVNMDVIETGNMLLVSKLIVIAALRRRESRGVHFREDFPKKERKWKRHIVLKKSL